MDHEPTGSIARVWPVRTARTSGAVPFRSVPFEPKASARGAGVL